VGWFQKDTIWRLGWFGDLLAWLDKVDKKMDEMIYKATGKMFHEGREYAERLPNIEDPDTWRPLEQGQKKKFQNVEPPRQKQEEVRYRVNPKEMGRYADAVIDEMML